MKVVYTGNQRSLDYGRMYDCTLVYKGALSISRRDDFKRVEDRDCMLVVDGEVPECSAYDYLKRIESGDWMASIGDYAEKEVLSFEDLKGPWFCLNYLTSYYDKKYSYVITGDNKIVRIPYIAELDTYRFIMDLTPLMQCAYNLWASSKMFTGKETTTEPVEGKFKIRVRCKNPLIAEEDKIFVAIDEREADYLVDDPEGRQKWIRKSVLEVIDKVEGDAVEDMARQILQALPPSLYSDCTGSDIEKALIASMRYIGI